VYLSAGLLCNFSFPVIHTSKTKKWQFYGLPSCRNDEFMSLNKEKIDKLQQFTREIGDTVDIELSLYIIWLIFENILKLGKRLQQ
jgi:hypothetical protein